MDAEAITVSVKTAVKLSGLSRATLYRALAARKISSTLCGSRRLIHVASLRAFLDAA